MNRGKTVRLALILTLAVVGMAVSACAEDPAQFDQRFGVVATDSSGWTHSIMPVQGPQYFEPLRAAWWYNYTPQLASAEVSGLSLFWPGYQRLYMFWKALATTSDAAIQDYARAAKAADPNAIIWWAMSNEPNDRGQANQVAADFAAIYLKHHKNLRIGDPTCKIMGPGLLNWTFQSNSCYQTGKSWYEEFRNAWAANPDCVAYSQSINGTNYPPQDAFCMHAYDLRGQSPVPFAPDDWRWCRDQMVACHDNLQTYPETQGLKIWNTEFASLKAPTMTQAADCPVGLVLWMRQQPWVERWFWFFTHGDKHGEWPALHLIDDNGNLSQLGLAYRDLTLLPMDASFYHFPYNAGYDAAPSYVRAGWSQAAGMGETLNAPGCDMYLIQNMDYLANTMRGRRYAADNGYIYKVRFNYLTNYDNYLFKLTMDTSAGIDRWQMDQYGTHTGYVEVDLSDDPVRYVAFGLCAKRSSSYTYETANWRAIVSNVMLLTCPNPPIVTDDGATTTGSDRLHASWQPPAGGKQPIAEYQYAIGTTAKATDVVGWTSAGVSTSIDHTGLNLEDGVPYYISVRAKDSHGHWGAIGCSDGIRRVPVAPSLASAKGLAEGSYCAVEGLVVSAVLPGRVYVQSEDRSCGIAVVGPSQAGVGDRVTVLGALALSGKEAVIEGEIVSSASGEAPRPVALNNLSSGGGAQGVQPAVTDSAESDQTARGLSTVGLLVKLWGNVTYLDPAGAYLYLDDGGRVSDGSGHVGVRVDTVGMLQPALGTLACVTGVMSAGDVNGRCARVLRPRSASDVQTGRIDNYLANASFEYGGLAGWNVIGTAPDVVSGTYYFSIGPHTGSCFLGTYANNALKRGFVYQRVDVDPGGVYSASAWSRVLHSSSDSTAARNRIGVDPLGGTSPVSTSVVWSAWDERPDQYLSDWRLMTTPSVTAAGSKVTVFLMYDQQITFGVHVNCFDTVRLAPAE